MKRVGLAFLCALALVAGACGTGEEATYDVDDLVDVGVQQSEVPRGTVQVDEASGRLGLDEFASDDAEKRALRENGFQGAQQSLFATPGLEVGGGGASPPDARLVRSFAAVFEELGGARAMYDFYREEWLPSRLEGEEGLPDPKFGQEAFGKRFSSFTFAPFPGVVYLWRDDNAVFAVLRASPVRRDTTPGQVLALGEAIERRAQGG